MNGPIFQRHRSTVSLLFAECMLASILLVCSVFTAPAGAQLDFGGDLPLPPPQLLDAPLPPAIPHHATPGAEHDADSQATPALASKVADLQQELEGFEATLKTLRNQDPKRALQLEQRLLKTIRSLKTLASKNSPQPSPATRKLTTRPTPYPAPNPTPHNPNQKLPRFGIAREEFQRLRSAGGKAEANQLEQQLTGLESALSTGEYEFPSGDTPEVHLVTLRNGTTLPKSLRTSNNQYRLGYAEVEINYTARPIILVLKAAEPILWKLTPAEGVRIQAVIFDSNEPQELMGLDSPLVLDTKSATENGLYRPSNGYRNAQQTGIAIAGSKPVASYKAASYTGQPIVLGAENKQWFSNYLIGVVDELIQQSRAQRRDLRLPAISKLRFTSTFISPSPFGPGGQPPQSNQGQFNIQGPISSTLKPLRHPQLRQSIVIPHQKTHLEFALDLSGRLVALQSKQAPDRLTPVPISAAIASGTNRFRSMTFDSKRQRLVLATNTGSSTSIVGFDIKSAEWSKIGQLKTAVLTMTYVPEDDQIWLIAATSAKGQPHQELAELLFLSDTGQIVDRKPISEPLGEEAPNEQGYAYFGSMWDHAFPQLVEAQGFAVFVGTRHVRHPSAWASAKPELFVIDPNTGDMVYSSMLKVNDGLIANRNKVEEDNLSTEEARNTAAINPLAADSVLADINLRLAQASSIVDDLAVANPTTSAALAEQLDNIRKTIAGQDSQRDKARLYLIGRYASTQPIRVRVTDTTGPVVLAISGYQSINWHIEAAEGVNITRIIAAGNQAQNLLSKPKNAKVESYHGNEGFTIFDARDAAANGRVATRLQQLTNGLAIAAVSAAHQSATHQITVGPQHGLFRVQIVRQQLDELLAAATRSHIDGVVAQLEKKTFFAIHHGALARQPNPGNPSRYHWNKFSIHGPIIGRGVALQQPAQYWSFDKQQQRLFLTSHTNLTIRDLASQADERIRLDQKDRRIGQINGIAFDSKRQRVLLNAFNSIVAFDPKTKSVETVCRKNGQQEIGMTYNVSTDSIYTVATDRTGRNELKYILRYNHHGVLLDSVRLSKPIRRGRIYSSANTIQLIDLDGYLGLIDYQQERQFRAMNGRNTRTAPTGHISVVAMDSGKIVYSGALQPTVERRDISPEEFVATWEKLGESSPTGLDQLLWDLAAGHEKTLAFLESQLAKPQSTVDEVDVAMLVKDLDDHRFVVRSEAYKHLQAAGCAIQTTLERMAAEKVSPEVRERLQTLITCWAAGEPQNANERQRVRALEILARLGTSEARQIISNLQDDTHDIVTRSYATRILNGDQAPPLQDPGLQFQQRLFVPKQPR